MLDVWRAALLGLVEGLTEYLPISSTGHLILAARALRLEGEAVKTFEIVIQFGAILAVVGVYRERVAAILRGVAGRDLVGAALLRRLVISTVPALVVGGLLHRRIKEELFAAWPVVWALAVGGLVMVLANRWLLARSRRGPASLEGLSDRHALVIGLAQCLALWPGMSRAMVTIVAGMAVGLPGPQAAQYSFLLALPTLGAATLYDAWADSGHLVAEAGLGVVLTGLATSALVAAATVGGLVRYLNRHGLVLFGWYRLVLAAVCWWVLRGQTP